MADEERTGAKAVPDATRRQGRPPAPPPQTEEGGPTVKEAVRVKASLDQIMSSGVTRMQAMTKLACSSVVAMEPLDDGWHLQIEMVEKESIPRGMDVLGLYDAWLDPAGNLLRFARHGVRRRADVSGDL